MSVFPDNRNEHFLEKPLPSNDESEKCVLGSVLLDPELIHSVSAYLQPEDFYSPFNRRVYGAMLQIAYSDFDAAHIDPIRIGEVLKQDGNLEAIGGVTAIANLTFGLPHSINIEADILLIKGKSALRQRIRSCNKIISDCLAEDDTSNNILTRTEKIFTEHVETAGRVIFSKAATMETTMQSFNQKIVNWKAGKVTGLPTPWPSINRRLNDQGLSLGNVSMVAARPSDGKTTFGVQCAKYIARHHAPALIISLEMDKEEIMQKLIASEAQVPNYRINQDLFTSEFLTDQDMVERIRQAEKRLKDIPLFIDDESQTLSAILATCHEYAVRHGVLFFFIDYAQLVRNDLVSNKQGITRDRELGQIAEEIKNFAKQKTRTKPKTHVMLAVQLKRLKAKPTIDDMRESGSFEQVADLILAPWGEKPNEEVVMREMKAYCLKQRKGRRDWALPFTFHGDWQTFYDPQTKADDQNAISTSLGLSTDTFDF